MKFKIKPALVPICIFFCIQNMAFNFAYPYLTLQMLGLGLTMQDVALVMGLAPFIGFFTAPLLGYAGDKLGYKMVLIGSIVITMILQTSFNFLPVYREFEHKIALNASFTNVNSSGFINQNDIVWIARYVNEDINCGNEYLNNISIRNIVCEEIFYDSDFHFDKDDLINVTRKECDKIGMDSCKFVFKNDFPSDEVIYCNVVFNDQEDVTPKEGSHELTLWLYFLLRVINNVMVNTMFNISDASASILARRERSSYSIMLLFGYIGGILPPFIVGPIVDHIHMGSSYTDCLTEVQIIPKDYNIPFLIYDGLMFIGVIFIFFFLEIIVEKKTKENVSLKQEFKWLANPAALVFYLVTVVTGFVCGAGDTFFFIYCQEVLGATTTFLGYTSAVSIASSICVLPFSKIIIQKLGVTNTICLGIFSVSTKVFAWAFPFSSPPYAFIAYGMGEALFSLYTVGVVNYVGKIAPPELIATGISLQSVLTWIVGKGLGSLVAGKLVDTFSFKIMFISIGMFGVCISILYWILYHIVLRKYELDYSKDLVEKAGDGIKPHPKGGNYISTGIFYTTHL